MLPLAGVALGTSLASAAGEPTIVGDGETVTPPDFTSAVPLG
jgi:hypothetical protein